MADAKEDKLYEVRPEIGQFVGYWGEGRDRRPYRFKAGVQLAVPAAAAKEWAKYIQPAK